MRWWRWLLAVPALGGQAFLLWWCIRRREQAAAKPAWQSDRPTPAPELPAQESDDLKRIEGIGPIISTLLNEAGIRTFALLAETETAQLDKILREAGITIADPGTWPEQAALAAVGKWQDLKILQDELVGGRRV